MKKSIMSVLVVLFVLTVAGWAQAATATYNVAGTVTLGTTEDGNLLLTGNDINFTAQSNLLLDADQYYNYSLSIDVDLGYSYTLFGNTLTTNILDETFNVAIGTYPGIESLNQLSQFNTIFNWDISGLSFALDSTQLDSILNDCGYEHASGMLNTLTGLLIFTDEIDLTLSSTVTLTATPVSNGAAAVPVPTAVWLLGSGVLGIAGLRRRNF